MRKLRFCTGMTARLVAPLLFVFPFLQWWYIPTDQPCQCFSAKDKNPGSYLARFIPTVHLRKFSRAPEVNRLEVSPQGHELFDDIVISVLILERLRTTPSM